MKRRVRLGTADRAPPFGRWTFGRLDYRAPELGAGLLGVPNLT